MAFIAGAINSIAGGGSFLTFPTLIFAGVPPISANATNNFAMWVGTIGSVRGFKEELAAHRSLLLPGMVVSAAGGLLGALLLLRTPAHTFELLIPFLLAFATLVFAFAPYFTKAHTGPRSHSPLQLAAQFLVAIYGGYFGAGIGILMLAILAFSGLPNLNAANALKNVLAFTINGIALIPFVLTGIISWPQGVIMALAAIAGGYTGARLGRRIPSRILRAGIILVGSAMAAYFFWKVFGSLQSLVVVRNLRTW